jgi:hypothetical protein
MTRKHKPPHPETGTDAPRYIRRTRVALVACLVVVWTSSIWALLLFFRQVHMLEHDPGGMLGLLLRAVLPGVIGLQLFRYRAALPPLSSQTEPEAVEFLRLQSRFWIVVAIALAIQLLYGLADAGYRLYLDYRSTLTD